MLISQTTFNNIEDYQANQDKIDDMHRWATRSGMEIVTKTLNTGQIVISITV